MEALADLNIANQLSPEWELPYVNRAQVALLREDWKGAVTDYTCAIDKIQARGLREDWPMLAKLYWNRAHAHRSQPHPCRPVEDLLE